jgi:hypothetical protein
LNVYEEEEFTRLHHGIHRVFGTVPEAWELLDVRGVKVAFGDLVERTEPEIRHEGPKVVKIQFRWQSITLPMQDHGTMDDVFLLIETILKLHSQWELRYSQAELITQIPRFPRQRKSIVQLVSETEVRSGTMIRNDGPIQATIRMTPTLFEKSLLAQEVPKMN